MSLRIAIITTDNRQHYKDYSAPWPYFGTAPEALLQGLAMLPELEVHVISCLRQPVQAPEKLADNIWYHSLIVPKIGWMSTGYQGCIRAVRKILREIQPHIVHGQGTEKDCAICAVFSGYPNVLTLHGNMSEFARLFRARPGSYHWLTARLEDFLLGQTAGVFCNSSHTETVATSRARQTWRVPNAVREPFFATPLMPRMPSPMPRIVNVGSVYPLKQQAEILRLAAELNQEGYKVEFIFAGEHSSSSEYGREFQCEIEKAAAAGYGSYVGRKSVESLIALFDQSDAIIHCPKQESFGLVVAEALSRNLKLFGAAVGGVVDIAKGIEMAELFPLDDWETLKQAIIFWLKQGAPKPTTAASQMAERYHPRRIALRHLEIYKEVLSTVR